MTYPGMAVHTSFNPRVPHPSQLLSLSSRMVLLLLLSFVAYTRHSQAQKVPKNSMCRAVVVGEVVVKGNPMSRRLSGYLATSINIILSEKLGSSGFMSDIYSLGGFWVRKVRLTSQDSEWVHADQV
ncbi:hypothetical protein IW262DRAFT_1301893 [Armillaria fumosa]|nr:hypothetical protein IW262DRAFT_1301893 [Armillaria fumosa]